MPTLCQQLRSCDYKFPHSGPCCQYNQFSHKREKTERDQLISFSFFLRKMSLLSDLINLNLSETTNKVIAEYVWWVFSHYFLLLSSVIPLFATVFSLVNLFILAKNRFRDFFGRFHVVSHWLLNLIWLGVVFDLFTFSLCCLCCPVYSHPWLSVHWFRFGIINVLIYQFF